VDNSYLTFRCQNRNAHVHKGQPKAGNIVVFLGKKEVIVRCPDSMCRSWVQLSFNFNGVDVDFRKAGIVQSVIKPGTVDFKSQKAAVVLCG
jgi:hypothetical protein